jgi:hypothetical protein
VLAAAPLAMACQRKWRLSDAWRLVTPSLITQRRGRKHLPSWPEDGPVPPSRGRGDIAHIYFSYSNFSGSDDADATFFRARGGALATSDSGNAIPFSICTRIARRSSEMRNTAT